MGLRGVNRGVYSNRPRRVWEPSSHPPATKFCLATAVSSKAEQRIDLRKDRADLGRNARHDRAGRDGHETRHQRVFDQILTTRILHQLQLQKEVFHFIAMSPLPILYGTSAAEVNLSSARVG